MMDLEKMKAVVLIPRCKGCDLCKVVCSTHNAITMHPVNQSTGEIIMSAKEGEAAGLGQAYAG
jgi:pyruvate ferredoxin oxidoreductase delta subunit